ncbi:MAG: hypothetical protein J7L45_01905 [Candidatus Aenigmarchaeota archaeon]|nr:hypothetical protein [Candidatus Aenigmarchaeota archaeon]
MINKITKFKFGEIWINGKKYQNDLILTNDTIESKESSHTVKRDDVEKLLIFDPDVIIIGTGNSGMVKVEDDVVSLLSNENIELKVEKTPEAVKLFNDAVKNKKVAAIFHVTC